MRRDGGMVGLAGGIGGLTPAGGLQSLGRRYLYRSVARAVYLAVTETDHSLVQIKAMHSEATPR